MLQETKQQTHHVRQNQIQHQFIPHNDISKTLTVKTSCCIRNYKHGSLQKARTILLWDRMNITK